MKNMFNENTRVSSMRVMAMMCCVTAIVIGIVGLFKPAPDYSGLSLLCTTFLATAFGAKVIQKRTEVDGSKATLEDKP